MAGNVQQRRNQVKAAKTKAAKFDPEAFEPVELRPRREVVEDVVLFALWHPVLDEDDEPVLETEGPDEGEPKYERVEYTVPRKVKFNITLQAAEMWTQRGEQAASVFMLRTLLGDENYETLINYEDLEAEQFERIMQAASDIVLGPQESGKARR